MRKINEKNIRKTESSNWPYFRNKAVESFPWSIPGGK